MSYLSKRLAAPVAAVALLMLSGTQVLATTLNAGGTIVGSPTVGVVPGAVLAASQSGSYAIKDALNATVGTGTYNIKLYSPDAGNSGNVTVVFNFLVQSGDLHRVTLTDFSNAGVVDVQHVGTGNFTSSSIDRSASGTIIGFNFVPAINVTGGPAQQSDTFILRSSALNYTTGSMSFIDGGTGNVVSFSPTSAPTPAAAWGGLSLLGLLGLSRTRRTA